MIVIALYYIFSYELMCFIAFKKTIIDAKWNTEKESTQYDFYISPKLLWEYTGIVYNEEV